MPIDERSHVEHIQSTHGPKVGPHIKARWVPQLPPVGMDKHMVQRNVPSICFWPNGMRRASATASHDHVGDNTRASKAATLRMYRVSGKEDRRRSFSSALALVPVPRHMYAIGAGLTLLNGYAK